MVSRGIRRIGRVLTGDAEPHVPQAASTDYTDSPVMPVDYFTQSASRGPVCVELPILIDIFQYTPVPKIRTLPPATAYWRPCILNHPLLVLAMVRILSDLCGRTAC